MPEPETEPIEPVERGGDPPCWAHLFEDEDEDVPIRDEILARLVRDLADAVIICTRTAPSCSGTQRPPGCSAGSRAASPTNELDNLETSSRSD